MSSLAEQGHPSLSQGFVLRAAQVATPWELLENAYVVVEGGRVGEVGLGRPRGAQLPVLDLGDVLLAPGFVDLHVHGGGGHDVNQPTPDAAAEAARQVARYHASHGTTSLLATTVSDSAEVLLAAVAGISAAAREAGSGVLGANLEGPWLSKARAGAQYPAALRPPTLSELGGLLGSGDGSLRLLTLAPELPGALEVIAEAARSGVVVSVGHTDADYTTAKAAFDAGARHATHLFNGMPPLHHREPGPVGAALEDPRVYIELVCDGVHVHPAVVSLVARLARERLVLVTDAIGPTGAPPGRYRLGPVEVLVSEERAELADGSGTIAGSVLTMDKAVAFVVNRAGLPLLHALQAASANPAAVLGERAKGRLSVGADADLVVLGRDLKALATLRRGQVVYDPAALLAPVALGAGQ